MEQHIDAKQGLLDCAMGREEEQRSALSFGLTLGKCRCHHTDRQTDKHKSENKATVSLNLESDSNINIINIFHKHHNIINDYHRLSLKCTPIQSQFATSFPLKYKSFELGDQL